MTDEEAIALAMLHGAYFWFDHGAVERSRARGDDMPPYFFVIDRGYDERSIGPKGTIWYNYDTNFGGAARAYCKRHNLLR